MSSATDELEVREAERTERERSADRVNDWLEGRLPDREPTRHESPALAKQQADAESFGARHARLTRTEDAERHYARLEERRAEVDEAFEHSPNVHRAGRKGKMRETKLSGGARYAIQYED